MIRFLIIALCSATFSCLAQNTNTAPAQAEVKTNDSLVTQSRDTVLLKSYATRYNPRKALLYAAVLPGLGQIYTKKYWKLPLVYGGMGFIGYNISVFEKYYTKYKLQLFQVIDGNPNASIYPEDQLRNIVNRAQRQRDFMIILMGGVYLLQIVDAHVDAHLKEFDLNPNLQVKIEPTMSYNPLTGMQTGFSMVVKF
jgi:hypothetical protein